ncbi:hypothetical protein [Bacillus sp. SM2101]|uniref:hypothetical protein n=1 Tax=Bacillus sp. SM2101 TaxID=2805366 RepID=UPI001BDE16E4|nr:hypothetical protein [Bacillus sp. SM2101]
MEFALHTEKKNAQIIDFQKLYQDKIQKEIDNISDKITEILHQDINKYTCWDEDIAIEVDPFDIKEN